MARMLFFTECIGEVEKQCKQMWDIIDSSAPLATLVILYFIQEALSALTC